VEQVTRSVVERLGGPTSGVTVGIHCHNDCGMAAANSIMAVKAGAGMVQGTINGIGERTGNADLCAILPTLALHVKTQLTSPEKMSGLTSLSHFVDETMNRSPHSGAPFVGQSAFAHKGGLHVAALERSPDSYQHIDPSRVGNEQRVLVSELSGRQNIMSKIEEAGISLGEKAQTSERALAILNRVKALENIGYTFEGADASVHLMILHASEGYCPPFEVLDYSAQVYDQYLDSSSRIMHGKQQRQTTARATVKVRTANMYHEVLEDGTNPPYLEQLEVSDGNGPVDALASALMRALVPSNPYLSNVELVDYKVRILDPESATGAATRVMIEFRDTLKDTTWTTVSVDRNVISASLNAMVDGFEFALVEFASFCMLCYDDDDDDDDE
jgi:2-isopropylmalate synthase